MPNLPKAPDEWFNKKIQEGNGIFDPKSFNLMMKAVKNFRAALDIGAHVGTWSIGMSKRFESVYAFEPMETNFEYLLKNIKGIENIHPIKFAVGDKYIDVLMGNGKENSGQSHIIPKDTRAYNDVNSISMITIDEWLPIACDVDLMKIDVEGYELGVLKGAKETIAKHSPIIQVELNGLSKRYGTEDNDVVNQLESMGYRLFGRENKDYVYIKDIH